MKRLIVLSIILSFVAVPEFAAAEDQVVREKRDGLIWHLVATPAYMFWSLNMHEGSHALMGLVLGYEVTSYKPYPHMAKLDDGSTTFVAGAVQIQDPISEADMAWISVAPFLTDMVLFAAADLSLQYMDHNSEWAPIVLFAGMFMTWTDFTSGLISGISPHSDIAKFQDSTGIPPVVIGVVGGAIAGIMSVRMWDRSKQVFFPAVRIKTSDTSEQSLLIGPGPGNIGLSMSLRF